MRNLVSSVSKLRKPSLAVCCASQKTTSGKAGPRPSLIQFSDVSATAEILSVHLVTGWDTYLQHSVIPRKQAANNFVTPPN